MKSNIITGTKNSSRGFTFIELLIGMVLIGTIAAMAVPRYVDAAQQEKDDSLWAQSVAVKNAHDAVLNKNTTATVTSLVAELSGSTSAIASGVQVQVSGATYVVPTYSNALCTEPTKSVNDKVGCVGVIAS